MTGSDGGPSLAELQTLLEKMTDRPWATSESGLEILGDCDHADGGVPILAVTGEARNADGPGVVSLVRAAPVLLEIAQAALAWRDQRREDDPSAAHDRLAAALARIRP